ncbi:hypothetical protein [Edaphobacter flagellatus]|uniref:hypothetical protein n=1 Tax=Edaphobacter flagellatus TaxID=1933044 RepID=UPI0021B178C4|nr:hypothetical protein [Edaphobacter flagellatus]
MPTLPSGKYQLKSLHEEIALVDRKLAHAQSFEIFSDEDQRNTAVAKLTSKRSLLLRKAQQMIDEGIEFNPSERPKSLRPEGEVVVAEKAIPVAVAAISVEETTVAAPEEVLSSFAGTSLDYKTDLDAYKLRSKSKTAHV